MAYNYKKLADVTLVESAAEPNILIEDSGDIKKISAPNLVTTQVKADWEETDPNSAAFILNKPDLSQTGGANVVTYTVAGGVLNLNGVAVTRQSVIDEWKNGSILRIDEGQSLSEIYSIFYTIASGSTLPSTATIYYYSEGSPTSKLI